MSGFVEGWDDEPAMTDAQRRAEEHALWRQRLDMLARSEEQARHPTLVACPVCGLRYRAERLTCWGATYLRCLGNADDPRDAHLLRIGPGSTLTPEQSAASAHILREMAARG